MNRARYSQIVVTVVAALGLTAVAPSALPLHAAEEAGTTAPAPKPEPRSQPGEGNHGWEVKPPCVLSNMSTCPPGTEDFDSLDLMPLHLLGIPEDYRSAVKPKGVH